MNRTELRQLAEDRLLDAAALLAAGRFSGAYYLAGYAVECGLKACILAYVETSGIIFEDKKYAEKCWTHNLEALLTLAELEDDFNSDAALDLTLASNWVFVKDWNETSRYSQKTQQQTQALYDAIAMKPNGIFAWITQHW